MSTLKAKNVQHLDSSSANIQTTQGGGTILTGVSTIGNSNLVVESNASEGVRIDSSGNVGIGTDNPIQKLHLASSGSGNVSLNITNDTTGHSAGSGAEFSLGADEQVQIWNYENTYFRLATNNSEKVRVSAGGSMGIGTNDPQCLLHLEGNKTSDTRAKIILADNQSGNGDFFFESGGAGSQNEFRMGEGSDVMITVVGDVAGGGTGTRGYVGINTTVPRETVSIAGTIRVENTTNSDERLIITHEGIDFQNTGAGSSTASTAHTLDDYEEGTWTPEYTASGTAPTFTYDNQIGVYTKIGNLVTVGWRIRTDSASGGSGNLWVTNLPFTIGNTDFDQRGVAAIWSNDWNTGGNPNHCTGRKGENNVQLSVWGLTGDDQGTGGQSRLLTVSDFVNSLNSNQSYCTFTYFVD